MSYYFKNFFMKAACFFRLMNGKDDILFDQIIKKQDFNNRKLNRVDAKLDFFISLVNNLNVQARFKSQNLYNMSGPVVSLTTIPDRIDTVHFAIESIFMQTVQPKSVVLYITDDIHIDSFMTPHLRCLCDRGLRVRQVKDVGPHTKLIYALQEFPDESIVTVDDDIIYPAHMIKYLLKQADAHPKAVVCNYARELTFSADGKVDPVTSGALLTQPTLINSTQQSKYDALPSLKTFPYGFCGVLYPPGALCNHVFDTTLIKKLCPTEDDIWFKAMSLLNNTPAVTTNLGFLPGHMITLGSQHVALKHINHGASEHHAQLEAVFKHFDLYSFFDGVYNVAM